MEESKSVKKMQGHKLLAHSYIHHANIVPSAL